MDQHTFLYPDLSARDHFSAFAPFSIECGTSRLENPFIESHFTELHDDATGAFEDGHFTASPGPIRILPKFRPSPPPQKLRR
jgi:hypothetical protein